MERNASKNGFLNWVVLMAAAVGLEMLSSMVRSATAEVAAAFSLVGALVALVSWFLVRLKAREETERLEMADLAASKGATALFANSGDETFVAKKAREQFERWFIPGFTILLFLVQAGAAFWFYKNLPKAALPLPSQATIGMAGFAGIGIVLFLLGSYGVRLARYAGNRLLRPGASALLLVAFLSGIAAIATALVYFGFPKYDRYVAWVLTALMAVIAVETLLSLIFELYRPRVAGTEKQLVYDSRIVGMLGSTGGIFSTAAQALDYQFGFKVSDTWFYQFLQQSVGRLSLFWLGLIWLCSCVVVLDPQEQGLLERFGSPVSGRPVLDPGWHLKFPWPIDAVHRHPVRALQAFNVGFVPDPAKEKERTTLWTIPHYKEEFNLLVASRENAVTDASAGDQAVPVNLLTVSIPVQYHIRDVRAWAYNHTDAAPLLERVATREVVKYLVSVDMTELMSFGRLKAAEELRKRIQKVADDHQLGVEIAFVGLQDIHPPIGSKEVQVAAAFEQVIGAEAQKEAVILEAQGYAAETLPRAQAEAVRIVNDAKALGANIESDAKGQEAQFLSKLKAHRSAPTVFRTRAYYDTFAQALAPTRKIVIMPTNSNLIIQLNLEDKIDQGLLKTYIEDPNKPAAATK